MTSDPFPGTTGELAIHVLRKNAAPFAEHAPNARQGNDPEHVHQTRVATRRMRAALRLFKDVLPAEVSGLNDELRWIAAQLGPARDLDVQMSRLHETAEELGLTQPLSPYVAWLENRRQRAFASLEDAFQSQRFIKLMECLQQLDSLLPDPATDRPLADDAPERLKRAYRKLRTVADELTVDSPPTAFHTARIRGKRLRYAIEFLEPVYGKPARRLIDRVTDLQDLLGDHQDGVVSVQLIHEAVSEAANTWPGETSLALGGVVLRERQHGERLRRRFRPTYREVQDAWKRLRRSL